MFYFQLLTGTSMAPGFRQAGLRNKMSGHQATAPFKRVGWTSVPRLKFFSEPVTITRSYIFKSILCYPVLFVYVCSNQKQIKAS